MIRLSKSRIEYLNYLWTIYSGCKNRELGICHIPNCWARSITQRFKRNYPNGFEPTFYPEAILSPMHLKKPNRIGVAFMGDLFGDWMNGKATPDPDGELWSGQGIMDSIFHTVEQCPQHTFIFLTKCPKNLLLWSPFPENCWVGATATNGTEAQRAVIGLRRVEATVRFISFEPLLGVPGLMDSFGKTVNWVITGAQSNPSRLPKTEWISEITNACRRAGIPYFLKNNLKPIWEGELTQDMPKGIERNKQNV